MKKLFITRFYNQQYYSKHRQSRFLLDMEEEQMVPDLLLRDVLDFCVKTDVCKMLNMSLMDLMQLDLATYETIKEVVRKENERKTKIIEDQQRDLDKRQQQLMGGVQNARQNSNARRHGRSR